jgi:hypothetical protein
MKWNPAKVLLIGREGPDEREFREYLTTWGCELCSADSPAEAAKILRGEAFDLVILEPPEGVPLELARVLFGTGSRSFVCRYPDDDRWWISRFDDGHCVWEMSCFNQGSIRKLLDEVLFEAMLRNAKKARPALEVVYQERAADFAGVA